ncbi:unnamed protein product [Coregonus sp. 'balchen']|nr:unnamed protein product [Coregonus sp. 'balchen']
MAALGDGSAPAVNGLIQQFTAITGATESVGKHMLEACNNNLEMAVSMFLDGGGIAEEPSTSSSSAGASSSRAPPADDEVRAPIPQKQDILVEPEPMFGAPKRRRPARSIFDGFRDFQTETTLRHQAKHYLKHAVDKKLSTLADLFRPPVELMHKGSFETAKDCGQLENKWLMINIQNVQDFACQCLNRDVWSNDAVRTIIREHFIFWQVCSVHTDGDERQKMVEWNQLDVGSFLEQVTGFLTEHGQLDGPASSHPPLAKRARSESLIDASEDSQLEAAIKASLQETHYESSSAPDLPNSPRSVDADSDGDSDAEPFSDSEGHISVDGSDNETTEPQEGSSCSTGGHTPPGPAPPTSAAVAPQPPPRPDSPPARHRKSPHKENSHRKEESKKNHLEPPVAAPARSQAAPDSEHRSGENHRTSMGQSSKSVKTETSDIDCLHDNGPKARLMLRYPDGQREHIALSSKAKLMALVRHVQSKGYPNERFELVTNFPRRKLAHLDYDITLQEAGLCPQETVFVQERN